MPFYYPIFPRILIGMLASLFDPISYISVCDLGDFLTSIFQITNSLYLCVFLFYSHLFLFHI